MPREVTIPIAAGSVGRRTDSGVLFYIGAVDGVICNDGAARIGGCSSQEEGELVFP